MRVAIITRDFPPSFGGVATHTEALVRKLRAFGVSADVFVGHTDIKTLLMPLKHRWYDYDVVHVQSAPYGAFVFGVPLVVTVHSPVLTEFTDYRNSVKAIALPALAFERISVSRAKVVLAVSETTRRDTIEMYGIPPEKVSLIGNGVDFGRFAIERNDGQEGVNTILMVSRLEPRKNVEQALDAISRLPRNSYHARIVGEGSQRRSLEEKTARTGADVEFLGAVDSRAVPSIYASSQVFVAPSRTEGFGLSLLEAMAAGCAVVASDIPTHRALIRHGQNGFLYSTVTELVALLMRALASPSTRKILGEAARITAHDYSWETVASRVLEAYQSATLAEPKA